MIGLIAFNAVKLFLEPKKRQVSGKPISLWVSLFFCALGFALAALKFSEALIFCASGSLAILIYYSKTKLLARRTLAVDPLTIFWIFFVSGLTVFGTGYMVLPALERIRVIERMWVDSASFLNSVAYGNLTPGPIVIASTYMGYKISGFTGALAATAGIFSGPILLMLILFPFLNRILKMTVVHWALAGLLPAVVGSLLGILPKLIAQSPAHYVLWVLPAFVLLASFKSWLPSWALMLLSGLVAAFLA